MYLKALEIQGFKSFADKTVIEFGKGITAIVGPNGSGKSNISDAIRWVMGEQSAKSLRGGNMQDIIFAGTQKRKALGFAEVSLIIDNSDSQLPIDYDEVVVTRRVYRSGESEFFINKSSVRLKDIHELFMDTGVGRDGYSIIGQGKIAEIVSAKSEDRRLIFEEASGISKFRYRKEEAERKLIHTEENLTRVNDIIVELEGQVEPLKIQSEKAVKFLNYREQLKAIDVNVALYNIEKYKATLAQSKDSYDSLVASMEALTNEIEECEKQTNEAFEFLTISEQKAQENREKQQNKSESLADFQSDIAILQSKITHNKENIKRIELEIRELTIKSEEFERSSLDSDENFDELLQKEKELKAKETELQDKLNKLTEKLKSQNELSEKIRIDILNKNNEIAELKNKISNIHTLSGSLNSRMSVIEGELSQRSGEINTLLEKLNNYKTLFKQKNDALINKKSDLDKKSKEHLKLTDLQKTMQSEYQAKTDSLNIAVSRRKLLLDMESSFDNYSKSVKSVMQAYNKGELGGVKLYGTVAQLLKVEKKYITAIEVALSSTAQNIVTENENDAKKAIEYLKFSKQGRATFLPVSAAKGASFEEKGLDKCAGYIGIASDLVNFEDKFEKLFKGLLARTVVVDNIDNAISIAKKYSYKFRIVTLEGELLTPGGSMSGGSKNNSFGIFGRANEIVELEKKSKILEKEISDTKNKINKNANAIDILSQEINCLKTEISTENEICIKLSSDISHTEDFIKSVTEVRDNMQGEKANLQSQTESLLGDADKFNKEIEGLIKETAILEESIKSENSNASQIETEYKEISEKAIEIKMNLSSIQKDIDVHNERAELAKARSLEITQSIQQKRENIEEIKSANEDLADDIKFKENQIEEVKEEIEEVKKQISEIDKSRKDTQDSIKNKQTQLKELNEKQITLKQEQSKIENKNTKAEVELENIINRLWEDYELTITTAQEFNKEGISISASQKTINELKEKIKQLGNINIDAIEEYKQIKERYDFLKAQRDDLVSAGKNLKVVISDMVGIMKKQFSEKFEVINKYFGEVFVELFGGGKAELILTEPTDVLSGGVEISVQPPGKAIKSILQLSGGEQAFVSIALLFSLLKVNPSPYCVLDEIEAALDDVNVFRFAEYLKNFAEKSQFVVVTHRRGTMECATILYGVTMQEQGVTKLLSMNIDEVVENGQKKENKLSGAIR